VSAACAAAVKGVVPEGVTIIVVPRAKGLLESPQRLPPHPFTAGGRRDFGALLQAKPDVFPGRLLIFVRAATRVINKVKGLNRVVYDMTSKPPGDDREGVWGPALHKIEFWRQEARLLPRLA
jgi:hypothetical protein